MPNEVINMLEIYGSTLDTTEFINCHRKYILGDEQMNEGMYWDFGVSVPLDNKKCESMNTITNNGLNDTVKHRENTWGARRGIISNLEKDKVSIETPWTPCLKWFKQMINSYPKLNFVLKYNDEYCEEFYGWAVACGGNLIGSEEVCLHTSKQMGGIELYKKNNYMYHGEEVE